MHNSCSNHLRSMANWKAYVASKRKGSVLQQLSSEYSNLVSLNRYYIKVIAEIILFCATHELPLRGHNESSDSSCKGVFLDMVEYTARHDKDFSSKMKQIPKNATYLSAEIQNEMLDILAKMVISKIKQECCDGKAYSISADETKDLSKKEILAVVIRYFCDNSKAMVEHFIGFNELDDLGAASVTENIISKLEGSLNLSLVNCVSATFDGASTMSGCITGVQARLKQINNSIV